MSDLIVALIIITGSCDRLAESISPAEFDRLVPQLRHVATRMEILDPRECSYVLARHDCWIADVDLLRRRYIDLLDAPRLDDSTRFPDSHQLADLIRQNREERRELLARAALELDRAERLENAAAELEAIYRVLDKCYDAQNDRYYCCTRRSALKYVKESISERDYALGQLPR